MMSRSTIQHAVPWIALAIAVAFIQTAQLASAQRPLVEVFPEQRTINVRDLDTLPSLPAIDIEVPFTVASQVENRTEQPISLDEAIRVALRNADVIRVLAGVSAARSGSTIYDVAISNTDIDQQTAVFDPTLSLDMTMNKTDRPNALFDPNDPNQAIFSGSSTDSINTTFGLSKRKLNGGTVSLNANAVGSYFEPGVFPLEPEYRSFAEIALRQPLMRGYGRSVNLAPVVISRINTERSYFQFKDSVQEMVRGVIEAYWNLVGARVEVWARQQQIKQSRFAYDRAIARKEKGLASVADVAQARSAYANFKASLITARSSLILNETALRNILGLDPSRTSVLVPTSMPLLERIEFDWNEVVDMAEKSRPDIVELKLVMEADRLALLQSDNQARPQFDGIANYRWDGLSGEMPSGAFLPNEGGRFAGFNLGVNFSVPIGLRQSRAALRRQELILARDQINLAQGIHQMVHQLTINYRNLDQFFEQSVAFKEAREAARLNFENQAGEVLAGRREFINILQAITDWGNAVSQEAQSITRYNTELANIERQTGTILETHGVRFLEERYESIGPRLLGIQRCNDSYPARTTLDGTDDRYQESAGSSDESFNLEDLDYRKVPGDSSDNDVDSINEEELRQRERELEEEFEKMRPGFEKDTNEIRPRLSGQSSGLLRGTTARGVDQRSLPGRQAKADVSKPNRPISERPRLIDLIRLR